MSKANDLLAQALETHIPDLKFEREYKPFELEYIALFGSTKGIREWMKKRNMSNFVLDFAFPEVKLYVEIQGFGFGHRGKGAIRDYKKQNQLVKAGWVGLVYPASEVKQNAEYIVWQVASLWKQLTDVRKP